MRAVVVSHWDVDGIASAAIAVRMGASVVKLSALAALPRILEDAVHALERERADTLIIADLNPSPGHELLIETSLDYAASLGVRILWLDHHEWPSGLVDELRSLGAEVIVDTGRVSAELVRDYLGCRDGVCRRLVEMAIDDDRFLNRDELAIKWRRILRWYGWRTRYQAVRDWARGRLWPQWAANLWARLSSEYEELMARTLSNIKLVRIGDYLLAAVRVASEKLHPGEVHARMLEMGVDADIYAMIYDNGVSLRSATLPLACIARRLGGGGHDNAAGIPGDSWSPEKLANALLPAIEECGVRTNTSPIRSLALR